ncbi:PAS domain-containing sensor histidine kinase [Adhaeribacter pallidiroseus]|uniref:histidine kinase n=1 Tax=Adhaeribacter pallidiroseus TaxID=2072847 RepID=A0A369Q261_9BACT|nr:PAS domain-containing sensor histidine kinase [Adhaeribacter pallidiroseus]RDC58854.1 Histidine kinase [Adhaeribacter pallidiroseus]
MKINHDALLIANFQATTTQFGQLYFSYNLAEDQFSYISPAFWELCQESPERFLVEPDLLLPLIYPEDKTYMAQEYQKLRQLRTPVQLEFRIIAPNQTIKWLSLNAHIVQHEEQDYISGWAYDTTSSKANITTLQKFNAKKDSTLEILSHDLASPFANIQGLVRALEDQIKAGNLDVDQIMSMLKADAKRGSDLIRDFVNNEFLESSQINLNKERVDIARAIADMMNNYKTGTTLIPKNFAFIPSQIPIFMQVDELKFMQVLNNLISNAIKFTPDKGTISLVLEDRDPYILITVADNGIGIPESLQATLFDKFTKARRPGLREKKAWA